MENSGLVDLLRSMNSRELSDFLLFVESPFFNRGRYRKESLVLLRLLIDAAPDFNGQQIGKEKLYPLVFGENTMVEGRIEKVMVELNKLVRYYWLMNHYMHDDQQDQAQIDFARILESRGFSNKAEYTSKAILKEIEDRETKNIEDYERLFNVSSLLSRLESKRNKWKNDLNIGKSLHYLDYAYYANKTLLLNAYLQLSKVSKLDFEVDVEDTIKKIQNLDLDPFKENIFYISVEILKLYASPQAGKNEFTHILNLLEAQEHKIDMGSLKQFYGLIRSYCSILFNQGSRDLIFIMHRINKDNLKKGYFYHSDKITVGSYRSIIQVALLAKDTEWAYEFLESHKDLILDDSVAKETYLLTLASYHYSCKEFQKALDVLPLNSQHLDSQISAKVLELKLLYELKSDLLEFKLDAFKMFVNRTTKKNFSEENRERYSNFINFLYQIVSSKPGSPNRGQTIVKRIQGKKRLVYVEWLIEKALELK